LHFGINLYAKVIRYSNCALVIILKLCNKSKEGVLKNISILGCLIICGATLTLISASTIYIPDPVFGQTAEFTTASTRGFFDLDTGEELQPPFGTFLNISEILDLDACLS
jgi:hypothetical protein